MHSLDFDEFECNLISSALKRLSENVMNTINDSQGAKEELLQYARAYSNVLNDLNWIITHNQRDSYTNSEIKLFYNALKQFPTNKDVLSLLNSIADYCKDFDIELP